jgi:hypothetical protein
MFSRALLPTSQSDYRRFTPGKEVAEQDQNRLGCDLQRTIPSCSKCLCLQYCGQQLLYKTWLYFNLSPRRRADFDLLLLGIPWIKRDVRPEKLPGKFFRGIFDLDAADKVP